MPSADKIELVLSDKVKVYGSGGGNKLKQFIVIYNLAKKLLREEKYDIITAQDQYYLALIGLCLAKKFKIGLEIQVHGFEKYYGVRKLIAKYVLRRANVVRGVSQRLKKQLINEFNVIADKITVVPIFVNTNLSLRDRTGGRSNLTNSSRICGARNDINAFIFLTVGRLVPVKNICLQIEVMAEVIKKYPNTELWIIGDGPESEKLKLEIGNWKLEINVKLFGAQKDVSPYYVQANAFILTSNSEGWGMAVIEAASFGLPIIMTDVGCAGEVIINNESGLVIPVGGEHKLAEAMLKIIEDVNLRKKLGANAELAVSRLPGKERTLELYKKSWALALKK